MVELWHCKDVLSFNKKNLIERIYYIDERLWFEYGEQTVVTMKAVLNTFNNSEKVINISEEDLEKVIKALGMIREKGKQGDVENYFILPNLKK